MFVDISLETRSARSACSPCDVTARTASNSWTSSSNERGRVCVFANPDIVTCPLTCEYAFTRASSMYILIASNSSGKTFSRDRRLMYSIAATHSIEPFGELGLLLMSDFMSQTKQR